MSFIKRLFAKPVLINPLQPFYNYLDEEIAALRTGRERRVVLVVDGAPFVTYLTKQHAIDTLLRIKQMCPMTRVVVQ